MKISLIVCTRNRAKALVTCLTRIAEMNQPADWELIVVDNGSTDQTQQVVSAYASRVPFVVRCLFHATPGLSNARNAGLAASRADVVAFTDDDCYVEPNFLVNIEKAFADPMLGYLTGRITLHDPNDYPATINESLVPFEIKPRSYIAPGVVKGANMAFRRAVLDQIGHFDPIFGSGALFPAEDCDAAARASLAGWIGRYDPDVGVAHHHGRRSSDIAKLLRDYDIGCGAYHAKLAVTGASLYGAYRGWRGILRRAKERPSCIYWESWGAVHFVGAYIRGVLT